jgi:hypothetical protein
VVSAARGSERKMKCEHCGQDKVLHVKIEKNFVCPTAIFSKLVFSKPSYKDIDVAPEPEPEKPKAIEPVVARPEAHEHELSMAMHRSGKI